MRRLSREIALQSLFQIDFRPELALDTALGAAVAEHDEVQGQVALGYAKDLVEGTLAHIKEIDALLQTSLKKWSLERLGIAERNILRLCIYEMSFAQEAERVQSAVAIDEAVELAKLYGAEKAPQFLNGILGTIARK